jgi:hypothetical protein
MSREAVASRLSQSKTDLARDEERRDASRTKKTARFLTGLKKKCRF